mmetsp:Transcript_8007/g.7089  ORF Transcript_8007/g.7089 Transcript_8007/m.7089 type:complete len:294 (+) Transcript_8007:200-1081(+)
MVIWVIALPVIALILMYKNVKKEEDNKIKQYFFILYQGLKMKHFYWEFVNSCRKVFILICLLLPPLYKILVPSAILIFTWRLQKKLNPYKKIENNEIEILAVNVGTVTLLSGMVFNSEDSKNSLNFMILPIIISLNVIFLAKWLILFFESVGEKFSIFNKASDLLRYILCQKKREENKELKISYTKPVQRKHKKLIRKQKNKLRKRKRVKQQILNEESPNSILQKVLKDGFDSKGPSSKVPLNNENSSSKSKRQESNFYKNDPNAHNITVAEHQDDQEVNLRNNFWQNKQIKK